MKTHKARICVAVCVRKVSALIDAVTRAAEVGDLVEIRFDYFDKSELASAIGVYARLRKTIAKPMIVTFRLFNEGGQQRVDWEERLAFWGRCIALWNSEQQPNSDLADIELRLLSDPTWSNEVSTDRLICSYHDFVGVPEDLYERMLATSARTLKIVVMAHDATDCIDVFDLLERAQRDGRDLIAIAMGEAGIMTRILGPSRGSFMTYGSLDEDSATAPGQPTAGELRQVYRIDEINRHTQILGVIGQPVTHSMSPYIQNAALAQANVNAVFIPIEVHDLDSFVRRMARETSREIQWNLRGLSVTAPHKTEIMKHLDWIEPAAKEIGAVNTIVLQDGALRGYNTDAAGFVAPLKNRMGPLNQVRCAVIGAGGAARAVSWALQREQATTTVFARNAEKARVFQVDFGVDCRSLDGAVFSDFDLVVNATPIGTSGNFEAETVSTANQLRGVRLAYDLVYNPLETQFMREAREAGCETIGGLEMLIGQAVEQFKLWTGNEPEIETMRRAAMNALQPSASDAL